MFELGLLELDGGADGLELSLESLSVVLGQAFLDLGRHTLDQALGLSPAQTGDGANGLEECRKLLSLAKAGKYDGYLLEGMACPGGCVGVLPQSWRDFYARPDSPYGKHQ